MIEHRKGISVAILLIMAPPLVTLIATAHQMIGTGGDGLIRARAVTASAPPATPSPATPGTPAAPATPATPAAPGPAAAPQAAAPPSAPTASAPPKPATPVPGRSAQDFSASRPEWEKFLRDADPQAGKQLAANGKPAAGVQACVACHGQAGITPTGGIFPNLAGLSSEYLAKQLADFRSGSRVQPLMNTVARALTEQEIGQLAAYYGSLAGPPMHVGEFGGEAARKLDVEGDGTRALPACANCHGLRGMGEGPLLPRLAGQSREYFIDQMNAFRSGSRQNDDVGVMRAFAQRLTAGEIEALAAYYAGPAPKPQ
ncbi:MULTISPECIES: c-type cytochrome [Achromobacter]|uniref:C-type cytochrome n=1 Tax=Achromobacter spanius TaxID=217203 RepID=A0ABY8GWX1_9BURK|nr:MULTISPECIES: c-type cytochrome [Achromobacter]WAI81424.1 c-type cytochrome [Achromobacter spanius]WEX96941.1 c-type cytochrome [Achromobacter sp. SS2-2022]WFP09342.1 c-type cytochrome [Achromobacter spanius]